MIKENKSSFGFKSFKVLYSELDFKSFQDGEIGVFIAPSGTYNASTKEFRLELDLVIKSALDSQIMRVVSQSIFEFSDELEQSKIPSYFTLNAPAITFPYLRAYIATLSALSGLKTINIPILNLVDLGERLKEGFSIVE